MPDWLKKGTFRPKRTDDLKPGVAALIGKSTTWRRCWVIEADDSEEYAGQTAWGPREDDWCFTWAPECDIEFDEEKGEDDEGIDQNQTDEG